MKLQIGLFFGGNSVEHEVSVISALQAFRRFDREKLEAALKNAPPADGTERVLELIEEIQG